MSRVANILPGRSHPCVTQRNAASVSSFSSPKEQQSVSRRQILHLYINTYLIFLISAIPLQLLKTKILWVFIEFIHTYSSVNFVWTKGGKKGKNTILHFSSDLTCWLDSSGNRHPASSGPTWDNQTPVTDRILCTTIMFLMCIFMF